MFTLDQIVKAADAVVAEIGPDTLYTERAQSLGMDTYGGNAACKYAHRGTPACLVGVVMHRLGVPIDTLQQWDASGDGAFNVIAGGVREEDAAGEPDPDGEVIIPALDIQDRAIRYLHAAQVAQDNGATWGEAVAIAKQRIA